ncbi:Nuclear fragile X mental retardation-interacting protein 2 [Dissostichus eleginoides]|uniref:Nuclear fragile X mental retardation-interacting protein 2 n=1 Tax=Dissostichus eleginoides TaxID=100907 RepID=A0AAD9CQK1_DISEL|nr:Nuclear fragile X mental retardation-interacting protein 2 [Dissostichus eleginoides]
MHIKTGTWEASNPVCESDTLCDPAVLVASTNSEPHIRNRRLSPGSGNCGGGGGSCISGGGGGGGDQPQPRSILPEGELIRHVHTFSSRDKERKHQQHKGRSLRRESQKGVGRASKVHQNQKERWVEDSLSLLKPPPAFPVQDSPAKLQPAVSYASKVKARAAIGGLEEEERPAIGVLLQNQWGLSFISEARPPGESRSPRNAASTTTDAQQQPADPQTLPEETPTPVATAVPPNTNTRPEEDESNGKLLLSCRHLVEALNYHSREWNAIGNKQKKGLKKVVWYKDPEEHPA